MPLNEPGKWKYFVSHVQRECSTEAVMLVNEWGKQQCWVDRYMEDKSVAAMEEGVKGSETFVCILSEGYFASEYCCNEMRWAFKNEKPIISTYKNGVNVGALLNTAPEDFRDLIKAVDSIALNASDPDYFDVGIKRILKRLGTLTIAGLTPENRLAVEAELKKLQGTDIHKANANGWTPLMIACKEGLDVRARALIEAGASVKTASKDNFTVLMAASYAGLLSVVTHILPLSEIDAAVVSTHETEGGHTALMYACSRNHEPCARALIEAKAALDTQDNQGVTALMLACNKNHEHCARALIEAKADLEKANNKGSTPLMKACEKGHELCARALLKGGATVDAVDNQLWTALISACVRGHNLCARALIEAGASVKAASKDNFTVLMAASYAGLPSVVTQVLPLSEIDAAVVSTHETQGGYTALMYASERGHDACVQALIKAGANKKAKTKKKTTALSLAKANKHKAVCALLK